MKSNSRINFSRLRIAASTDPMANASDEVSEQLLRCDWKARPEDNIVKKHPDTKRKIKEHTTSIYTTL